MKTLLRAVAKIPLPVAATLCLLSTLALSVALVRMDKQPWSAARHLLFDIPIGPGFAATCGVTASLVLGALLLAVPMAFSLAWLSHRLRLGMLSDLLAIGGRALAALPIYGVVWFGIGWLIATAHLPIQSLLPYTPLPELDHWQLAIARDAWAWLVPMLLLALPLLGQWLTASVEALAQASTTLDNLSHTLANKTRTGQLWSLAWQSLYPQLIPLSFTALGYAIITEHALGLPGWGYRLVIGLQQQELTAIATATYALGLLATTALLVHTLISRLFRAAQQSPALANTCPSRNTHRNPRSPSHRRWLLYLVLLCGLAFALASPSFRQAITLHASALSSDLRHTGIACLWSLLGLLIAHLGLAMLPTFSNSYLPTSTQPWLLWAIVLAASPVLAFQLDLVLGFVIGIAGSRASHAYCLAARHTTYSEAARALGVPGPTVWRRHILPLVLPFHLAWLLRSAGTLLLWRLLITSISTTAPTSSLGITLSALHLHVIDTPNLIAPPTLLAALCILALSLLSRLVSQLSVPPSDILNS